MPMTKAQVEHLQRELNAFTEKYLAYVTPLIVDGHRGQSTRKRTKVVKFYLGYPKKERNGGAGKELLWRLNHPKRYSREWAPVRRLRVAAQRRIKQRRVAKKNHKKLAELAKSHDGFGTFDGKTVAKWMISRFEWARTHKVNGRVWIGTVESGVRTPEYSEHLCFEMCDHPTCPGRCAGRGSNHNMLPTQGEPKGAADVTDYEHFEAAMNECPLEPRLINRLPNDKVHFSATGH